MSEHTAFQIRPQFSLNVKWERMLAGAHALEKGFQVIDQDPIEEMVLGCSPLVGMGWVVKRGGHGADGIATCIPSKAVVDPRDAAILYALTRSDVAHCFKRASDANRCSRLEGANSR